MTANVVNISKAAGLKFDGKFKPENLEVLGYPSDSDEELVVAFTEKFRGRTYLHIRKIYKGDDGYWHPGKGLSINPNNAATIFDAAGKLATKQW